MMNREVIQQALRDACRGNETDWNEFENIYGNELTIEDFRVAIAAEANDNRTVLCLALLAALIGNMKPWNFIQEHFAADLTLEDFRTRAEPGDNRGATLLWIIMLAMMFGHMDPWNFIQEHFGNELTLEDFRVTAEFSNNKGKTVLLFVILAAAVGRIEPWNFIQTRFANELTINDFRATTEEGIRKGDTVLWHVILGGIAGHMEPWNFVQAHFSDELTLEDFLVVCKEKTLLQEIMLFSTIFRDAILSTIMSRFFFVHEDMNVEGFSEIYAAKRDFITFLDKINFVESPEPQKVFEELLRLAETAHKQGFLEAYYMAAVHKNVVISREVVIELLAKVDAGSLHYHRANQLGLAESIALLWEKEKGLSDHHLFKRAALFCLRLKDLDACKELFRCYLRKRFELKKVGEFSYGEYDAFLEKYEFYEKMKVLIDLKAEDEVLASRIVQCFDLIAIKEENKALREKLVGKSSESTSTPLFNARIKRGRETTAAEKEEVEPPLEKCARLG